MPFKDPYADTSTEPGRKIFLPDATNSQVIPEISTLDYLQERSMRSPKDEPDATMLGKSTLGTLEKSPMPTLHGTRSHQYWQYRRWIILKRGHTGRRTRSQDYWEDRQWTLAARNPCQSPLAHEYHWKSRLWVLFKRVLCQHQHQTRTRLLAQKRRIPITRNLCQDREPPGANDNIDAGQCSPKIDLCRSDTVPGAMLLIISR